MTSLRRRRVRASSIVMPLTSLNRRSARERDTPIADGSVQFDFRMGDADAIDIEGSLRCRATTNGTLAVRYSFRAIRDVTLNSIGLYIMTMPDDYAGGYVTLDGESASIPLEGHVSKSGDVASGIGTHGTPEHALISAP